MEDLYYQYNPWWEEDGIRSVFVPRPHYIERMIASLNPGRALFLLGMRRVGKTTLLRLLVDRLLQEGHSPSDIFYISLDDYLLRSQSILDIVSAFRTCHKHPVDRPVILIFDEITFKKEYHLQIKNILDRESATVIATSSYSSVLRDEKAYLTGRSRTIEIMPLTFQEYLAFKQIRIAKKDQQLLNPYFEAYMRDGGLPENVLYPSREYLMGLVDDIIQKDIAAYYGVRDHQVLRDYFVLLMERSGKQVSINKISNILKISPDTSRRYLGYFENAFLIHLVSRWGTTNEKILSPKKVYACDLGIKYLFIGPRDKGSYFENYIFHLLRTRKNLFYVYENAIELDFITDDGLLIECKYNSELQGAQRRAFETHPAKQKRVIGSLRDVSYLEQI
jgi:hypothetical protein